MMAIRPLTESDLRAAAQEAAQQRIPMDEANHHEPGTQLWEDFNRAYVAAYAVEVECA